MAKLGYTINPGRSAVIDFDESKFASEVAALNEPGFEIEQSFDGYDIAEIKTIVIVWTSEARVQEVVSLYHITWSDRKLLDNGTYEYIFRFIHAVPKKKWHQYGKYLSQIYNADYQLYSTWSRQCTRVDKEKIYLQPTKLHEILEYKTLSDSVNESAEQLANTQSIEDVLRRLKANYDFDTVLNIVPGYGYPFNTAVTILGSVETAQRFFNNEYDSGFLLDSWETAEYVIEWIALTGKGVYLSPHGGYMRSWAKQDVKMTNFEMKVHYKIIKPTGENVFIVTIKNEQGLVVPHIEWKNSSSEQLTADSVMKYGNFHVMWGKESVLKLHEMVSSAQVPMIYAYSQYGYNIYKGNAIMIFPNGVWDMDQRKFFPCHDTLPYTFMGSHDGVMVDSSLSEWNLNKDQIAHFYNITNKTLDDYATITKNIYNDDTAYLLWMYACSMAGVAAYYQQPYVPSYYIGWVTGSGKSTFATFVARAFWVTMLYNIRESTVYPLKILLSSFKWFPVFLSEYRSEMKYADDKKGLIQMCYDRSETAKWLKTWQILKYKMEWQVFAEGEDTYDEGSLRTRSIKYTAQKQSRMLGSLPMAVLEENKNTIQSFFSTYLARTDKAEFDKYRIKWQKLFAKPWVEPRISDNIGFMYAWSMAFAPDKEELITRLCKQLLDDQVVDYNENGESQKIVRLISQYVSKKWTTIYLEQGYLTLNWVDDIIPFREKTKISDMQLSMDAYKGHLLSLGWESWFYEVTDTDEFWRQDLKMIQWVRIPIGDCPRDLFTNSNIYASYRQAKKA